MIPLKDVIPSRTTPIVTISLIVVFALAFLLQRTLSSADREHLIASLGLVPAFFSFANVLTSMFLHAGFAQLGANLLYLWIFGENVEDRLGHVRFLVFYLAAGAVAGLTQTGMDQAATTPIVGASGAVAGVMGGYFMLYRQSRVLTLFPFPLTVFEVPAVFFLAMWFLVQFLIGLASQAYASGGPPGGVAFWGQVTGFLTGVVLVRPMQRPERQRVEWWSP
jgi:membrane associated rhomboid family serine protease